MPKKEQTYLMNRKDGLYLQMTTTIKGRGLFCKTAIKKGEQIEANPTLILNEKENAHIDKTILADYVFTVGKLSKRINKPLGIKNFDDASCVIYGIATFCNHDEHPNAQILWEERDGTLYHVLQATRAIPKDTEIVTSYGTNWFEDRPKRKNSQV